MLACLACFDVQVSDIDVMSWNVRSISVNELRSSWCLLHPMQPFSVVHVGLTGSPIKAPDTKGMPDTYTAEIARAPAERASGSTFMDSPFTEGQSSQRSLSSRAAAEPRRQFWC